ncbi:MAG TPA: DUF58 domain-containing protein [Acidimicrobiales bacterium]
MLTRNGWLLLLGGAVVAVAGRAFALMELYVLAAGAVLLVALALAYVRWSRLRLRVRRAVTPTRVHAGDTTRVELAASNLGPVRTPLVKLRDPVGGTRGALLGLAPLRPQASARAAYRLPTTKRGVMAIGPLTVELSDPFGLVRRTAQAAPVMELTVYPRVDRLGAPRGGGDRNPDGSAFNPNALGRQGDEFYAVRSYVLGDDLRRVHWPSTARNDELMVRQDEMPWQDRTTIVLDVRRAPHSTASFERAVSAAASCMLAATRERHLGRLITSDGYDTGNGFGAGHAEGAMEYLARVGPSGHASLRAAFDRVGRTQPGGVLVAIVGRATAAELDLLARMRRSFRSVIAVVTEGPEPPRTPLHGALKIVDATADGVFAESWTHVVAPPAHEAIVL